MVWWWTAAAWAGGQPAVDLTWKGERAQLDVRAPAGAEIAHDGPVQWRLEWSGLVRSGEGTGAAAVTASPLGDIRGASIVGALEAVLCEKATGTCTPGVWHVDAEIPPIRRGALSMGVAPQTGHAAASPFGPDATAGGADAAFTRARAAGKLVLLDFSAVWCPPCMQVAAEILHADPVPEELGAFELAILDVDHRSSWDLKDRYAIGSYPTLVAVDADGNELDRFVGYEGREAFLAWLSGVGSGEANGSLVAELSADPATVTPDRAAALAWILVDRSEHKAAAPWIARAAGSQTLQAALARVNTTPTADDVRWLLDNAPERAGDFAFAVLDLAEAHPALASEAAAAMLRVSDAALGDALYLAAKVEPDAQRAETLYAAAAASVRAGMGEHEAVDKASIGWLARLTESAGDVEEALTILRDASERYAPEPTFDLSLSAMLLRQERLDEALTVADRALQRGWGDIVLRAARTKAKVLDALGRGDDARAAAQAALDAVPAPAEGVDVRTHRYRALLEEWTHSEEG